MKYSEVVDSVIVLFSSITPRNVTSVRATLSIPKFMSKKGGPKETHDTIGTFPRQSSVKLQRVRIDL